MISLITMSGMRSGAFGPAGVNSRRGCQPLAPSGELADDIPVRADVAMTGEITLRGEVLPIGGLKEKLLAARRGGIKTVIIPKENERDLKEVPDNIKEDLEICPVKWIDEVLSMALEHMPEPLSDEEFQADALSLAGEGSDDEKNRINTH